MAIANSQCRTISIIFVSDTFQCTDGGVVVENAVKRLQVDIPRYRDERPASRACAWVIPADQTQPIFINSTSWLQSIPSPFPTCANTLEISCLPDGD
jgi:hypothetical protein